HKLFQHALGWGFRPDPTTPISYWSGRDTRAAGVAILINPHAGVTNVAPWQESMWSPRFMAITFDLQGSTWLLVDQAEYYGALGDLDKPSFPIMIGGNFNYCLYDLDRSRGLEKAHGCTAMEHWLQAWDLNDALSAQLLDKDAEKDRGSFAASHHTYRYRAQDGDVTSLIPGVPSDHLGIMATLLDPAHRSSQPTSRRVLAKSTMVRDLQNAAVSELLLQLTPSFLELNAPEAVVTEWERIKVSMRCITSPGTTASGISPASQTTGAATASSRSNALRQQSSRHSRVGSRTPLQAALAAGSGHDDAPATGTDQCAQEPTSAPDDATTAGQYQRATATLLHGKHIDEVADLVEADWQPIMERSPTEPGDRHNFLHVVRPAALIANTQSDILTAEIDQAEIARSLKRCRKGKACGPDGLPNDLYRDQFDVLLPLIEHLSNVCYTHHCTPATFREADNFCLAKKTSPASGLDSRPLALLNTDYEVFKPTPTPSTQ
ncbi:TPA: hypothetical protein N0F65_007250, partial [Lagenidium giganteum]